MNKNPTNADTSSTCQIFIHHVMKCMGTSLLILISSSFLSFPSPVSGDNTWMILGSLIVLWSVLGNHHVVFFSSNLLHSLFLPILSVPQVLLKQTGYMANFSGTSYHFSPWRKCSCLTLQPWVTLGSTAVPFAISKSSGDFNPVFRSNPLTICIIPTQMFWFVFLSSSKALCQFSLC